MLKSLIYLTRRAGAQGWMLRGHFLKGLWYRGHYLHDGSVASLEAGGSTRRTTSKQNAITWFCFGGENPLKRSDPVPRSIRNSSIGRDILDVYNHRLVGQHQVGFQFFAAS